MLIFDKELKAPSGWHLLHYPTALHWKTSSTAVVPREAIHPMILGLRSYQTSLPYIRWSARERGEGSLPSKEERESAGLSLPPGVGGAVWRRRVRAASCSKHKGVGKNKEYWFFLVFKKLFVGLGI